LKKERLMTMREKRGGEGEKKRFLTSHQEKKRKTSREFFLVWGDFEKKEPQFVVLTKTDLDKMRREGNSVEKGKKD